MIVGTVVGNVWATQKDESLTGLRFLVIQPLNSAGNKKVDAIVAVDPLGAAIGQRVLIVHGRAARHAIGRGHDIGFQTAVAAIIDRMELEDVSVGPTEAEDHR